MNAATNLLPRSNHILCSLLLILFSALVPSADAQQSRPTHGAISAQDLAKRSTPAATGSDTADQVCARFSTGSVVSAPPELKSQNGVLEVTMQFLATTDSQGLVRYCYVTNTGLEAPTLRVNPGDQLIIHFQNNLPANLTRRQCHRQHGRHEHDPLREGHAAISTSSACNGACGPLGHQHPLPRDECGAGMRAGRGRPHAGRSPGKASTTPYRSPPTSRPDSTGITLIRTASAKARCRAERPAPIVEGLQNVDPALAGLTERTFVLRDQMLPASELNDTNIPAWDLSINYVPVTYPGYTPAVIQTNPGAAGAMARRQYGGRHHHESAIHRQRRSPAGAGRCDRRLSHRRRQQRPAIGERDQHALPLARARSLSSRRRTSATRRS